VVSSPPATEETGGIGREIESHQGICRVVTFKEEKRKNKKCRLSSGNAYNAKVWMGLYDFKSRISVDTKDDDSIRELVPIL
jgi:hypothetical protein